MCYNAFVVIMRNIIGYKSVDENFKDISGNKLEENKTYHVNGKVIYGNGGNGYHFAKKLEDTLRYQLKDEDYLTRPNIAKVVGFGDIVESFDEYYGYYELYAAKNIKILKYLSEEEIINYALNLREDRMLRFVSLYRLNSNEIKLFKNKYLSVDLALLYYQMKIRNTYELFYSNNYDKVKKLVRNI